MTDSRTAPYAALLLRLTLGVMFIAHGLFKVFVFTVPGTVQFFGFARPAAGRRLRHDRGRESSAARCSCSASARAGWLLP